MEQELYPCTLLDFLSRACDSLRILVLRSSEVEELLKRGILVEGIAKVFAAFSDMRTVMPPRMVMYVARRLRVRNRVELGEW